MFLSLFNKQLADGILSGLLDEPKVTATRQPRKRATI
jgi:hypothetical protein